MFNTLGNLVINPHAGLVFLDFDRRSQTLQLTGRATIQWHLDDPDSTGGTHRYWDFAIEQWLQTELTQFKYL